MRRTAAEAAQTREAILTVGRSHFAEHGFAATSLDVIAASSKVTRGAVHHHFGDKAGLFREVLDQINFDLNDSIREQTTGINDPWASFVAAVTACLHFCARTEYLQIVVCDAPGVLGAAEYHKVDAGIGTSTIGAGLRILCDRGILSIPEARRPMIATMLFGALTEIGISVAQDPSLSIDELREAFLDLVLGFRPSSIPDEIVLTEATATHR